MNVKMPSRPMQRRMTTQIIVTGINLLCTSIRDLVMRKMITREVKFWTITTCFSRWMALMIKTTSTNW